MKNIGDIMESPFLEISIEQTSEKSISEHEIISRIAAAFQILYGTDAKVVENGDSFHVSINFNSISDFEKIYEKPYSMYTFLFDHFINENVEFENLFLDAQSSSTLPVAEEEKNYLVLRYRTNCITPMRRYYGFTVHVNKIFGDKVINEEIADGYLRFLKTKVDFEALLVPGDVETGWKKRFEMRKVDTNHPLILEFFNKVREWKQSVDESKN